MGTSVQQMSTRIEQLSGTLHSLVTHLTQQAQAQPQIVPAPSQVPITPVALGRTAPGSLNPSPERPAGYPNVESGMGFFDHPHLGSSPPMISADGFGQESQPAPSVAGSRMSVDDGKNMSRADRWLGPVEKPKVWKGRLEEIVGFQSYFSYLQSYLGNLSDRYPREMNIARASSKPIMQGSLSGSEVVRSVRLQSLLLQLFSDISKANGILLSYKESCETPCGYESLRLLRREFSLYSTTEALPFRNRILAKTYKEASITEVFNTFDLEAARYARLISSLGGAPGSNNLQLSDADKCTIILRSLPERCREWTVLGLQTSSFDEVRERALLWEHRHRCWSELEKPVSTLKSFQGGKDDKGKGKGKAGKGGKTNKGESKGEPKGKGKGQEQNKAVGTGKGGVCYLCGKPGHFAKDCPKAKDVAQQERLICHKCGGKGHIASVCPSSKASSKGTGGGKGQKGKKGGKSSLKGMQFEDAADPVPEPSPTHEESEPPIIQMSCLFAQGSMSRCRFDVCEPNTQETFRWFENPCVFMSSSWLAFGILLLLILGQVVRHGIVQETMHWVFVLMGSCVLHAFVSAERNQLSERDGLCEPLLSCSLRGRSDLSVDFFRKQVDKLLQEETLSCSIRFAGLSGAKDQLTGESDESEPFPQSVNQVSLDDLTRNRFWLLDSGASAHVVREADLQVFEVISRKQVEAKFTAAHGNSIYMNEIATVEVPVVMLIAQGNRMVRKTIVIQLDAFVGDVQSNVLSIGALTQRGWEFHVTKAGGGLVHKKHKLSVPMYWFANCPWIASDIDSQSIQTKQETKRSNTMQLQLKPLVAFESAKEEEAHRLRGHLPPDPRHCPICAKVRGVSQSRRKDVVLSQIQADFCFVQINETSFKVLVLAHGETGCIGAAVCGASINTTIQRTRDFLAFLGLTGHGPTVELTTDAESAVSKIVKQCNLDGRHVVVQRAAPQEHQTIGLAEGANRRLKEGLETIKMELDQGGVKMCANEGALQMLLTYWCLAYNRFSKSEFGRTPKEELFEKQVNPSSTARFGQKVLAECPESLKASSRFVEAMYLSGKLDGQLGHLCGTMIDGEAKLFTARNIKLIIPSSFATDLFPDIIEVISDHPLPQGEQDDLEVLAPKSEPPRSAVESKSFIPYDGKSNPPIQFYREHGFSKNCKACEVGVKGRVHSSACRKRYMDFLKDEAKRAVEKDPEKEKEKENTDHMDAESEEYTPTEPLPPDERPERYRITGKSPAGHLFQPPPANSHHHDSSPPQDEFMEGSSPPWTANAGTHEDEAMDIDADLKQIIQQCLVGCEKSWDGMLDSFYLTDMSQPGVLYSIRYDEIKRESIEVCGTRVWQAVPTLVRDELSSELLDAKLTLAGIRREYGHMSEKQIGTCASGNQAKQLAMEWGIRIIGTRWVIVRKIRKTESGPMEEVRCRCVVQDVRDGTSAVMHGYSSPTSSVETLKILLAVAGWFDYAVLTADVATAYMSSPLPDDVKAIIRLPAGTMYGDGTPVYVILKNAINGLRPASLAWVLFFRNVVEQKLNLSHSDLDPTVFTGYFEGSCVAVLTYVDDLLFIAKNLNICRKMLSALREMLEIKETGAIGNKAEKGGELTFIGRRMMRLEGSSKLYVTMEQNFNDALKSAGKGLKPADAMPDLKHYLEADDPASLEPLSPDKQTEFRSALGKVLWMVPFRPDLAIATSLISTGQATPQVKHSRALKAMLRFVLGTLDFAQSFPMDTAEEYLAFLERQCIETTLVVYADASYAPMRSLDRRSISGAVIVFLGSMIRAFAKTQHSVTLSSAEAELEALLAAVQEGRGLFKISAFVMGLNEVFHEGHVEFHDEYGSRIKEMIVLTDSSAAKAVLLRQDVQRRLRHSEIKLEFLKSLARRGLIKI